MSNMSIISQDSNMFARGSDDIDNTIRPINQNEPENLLDTSVRSQIESSQNRSAINQSRRARSVSPPHLTRYNGDANQPHFSNVTQRCAKASVATVHNKQTEMNDEQTPHKRIYPLIDDLQFNECYQQSRSPETQQNKSYHYNEILNNDNIKEPKNNAFRFKLKPPKEFKINDDFKVFRLMLQNFLKQTTNLDEQKSILLSLLDSKVLNVAYPLVESGQSMVEILNQLQTLFSPDDEMGTKLNRFHELTQFPGETISQFALRITEFGHLAHPSLNDSQITDLLVNQFVKGLLDTSVKSTLRLLAPKTLAEAVVLVKRSQGSESVNQSAQIAAVKSQVSESIICQLCNANHGSMGAKSCTQYNISPKQTHVMDNRYTNVQQQSNTRYNNSQYNRPNTNQNHRFNNQNQGYFERNTPLYRHPMQYNQQNRYPGPRQFQNTGRFNNPYQKN
jgi:hypothetical protein